MKLWQKTYLLSTLLCALILYGCMFGVTAPALTATVKGATDTALREERAIAGALEVTMAKAPEGRQIPVLRTFLDYYANTGLTFQVTQSAGKRVSFRQPPEALFCRAYGSADLCASGFFFL